MLEANAFGADSEIGKSIFCSTRLLIYAHLIYDIYYQEMLLIFHGKYNTLHLLNFLYCFLDFGYKVRMIMEETTPIHIMQMRDVVANDYLQLCEACLRSVRK